MTPARRRGRRLAFTVAATGLAVLLSLGILHWDTIRHHVWPVVSRAAPRPRTKIHQVRFAKAEEIVLAIEVVEAFPQARVIPHVGTNTLLIQAPPEEFEGIVKRIEELDTVAR